MMNRTRAKTFWGAIDGTLALQRAGEKKTVARVQRLDESRWLALVFYDSPGHGAASVRPSRESAVEWVSETVASAWPLESAAGLVANEAFQVKESWNEQV